MTAPRKNLTGRSFGRLTAVRPAENNGSRTRWHCVCVCGGQRIVDTKSLLRKTRPVQSCGCLIAERSRQANTQHGMRHSREYSAWQAMLSRCRNPGSKDFAYYGAVGVRVCERWFDFTNFLADMGRRPTGTTIERNDLTGDYCPGNCRWATYKEQAQNRRTTPYITIPLIEYERIKAEASR